MSGNDELFGEDDQDDSESMGEDLAATQNVAERRGPVPGLGHEFTYAHVCTTGEERCETINLVELLSRTLTQFNYFGWRAPQLQGDWVVETVTGMRFSPRFVSSRPIGAMQVETCTTIECRHDTLFPDGLYEYQHSKGPSNEQSFLNGFEHWAKLDSPVLLDAVRDEMHIYRCPTGVIELPTKSTSSPSATRKKLAVFGQLYGISREDFGNPDGSTDHSNLLTKSLATFCDLADETFIAIRLFCLKEPSGAVSADCRVNGQEWQPGKDALCEYATSWPNVDRSVFRKQYVVLRNVPPSRSVPSWVQEGVCIQTMDDLLGVVKKVDGEKVVVERDDGALLETIDPSDLVMVEPEVGDKVLVFRGSSTGLEGELAFRLGSDGIVKDASGECYTIEYLYLCKVPTIAIRAQFSVETERPTALW